MHRAINPIQTGSGLGKFLTPGQLTVTGVKHPPPKHTVAYNIGYKLGTADGRVSGAGLSVPRLVIVELELTALLLLISV